MHNNTYYINQINEKDKEILRLKNEINKYKKNLSNSNLNNEKENSSYFIKKNSNVDDILRHCETIIHSKDINIETLKMNNFTNQLAKVKQRCNYILELYNNKYKQVK